MTEEQKTQEIEIKDLIANVDKMAKDGYRFVQISCINKKEYFELNYTFDKNYLFANLRIQAPMVNNEIPSISGIYWGAFIYENEIHDLFGINVKGINIDFKGTFYQTKIKTPFNVPAVNEQ